MDDLLTVVVPERLIPEVGGNYPVAFWRGVYARAEAEPKDANPYNGAAWRRYWNAGWQAGAEAEVVRVSGDIQDIREE